jgi:hypothetical protein
MHYNSSRNKFSWKKKGKERKLKKIRKEGDIKLKVKGGGIGREGGREGGIGQQKGREKKNKNRVLQKS